ncbi:DEAD/DEAH box helicase [Methylobacterium sp. Leaf456]|uniref:helicase-related protein n=1 Tax=Methylobacterium sp. Leaf456 TaxID=1736382 RepID=UPI0006FA0D21|nr:helicase-related protein [Methylobacterium sp. Leaf456]KQT57619.1 DEAD/DEAH box helicase [Methylobacterium sp. Leaf456]
MAAKKTATKTAPEPSAVPLVPTGALAVSLLDLCEGSRPLVHVARDGRRLEEVAAILRALAPERKVAVYPEWDCLPFDRASPSRGVMGARAGVLRWLTDRDALPDILLTTAPALLQRVPPPETWGPAHVEITVGDRLDPEALTAQLARLGYQIDDRVDEPGEVAVRGRTIDVFPAAAPLPCRIEHADGRVTAIRAYDPVSQRSRTETERLVIDPATEIVPDEGSDLTVTPFTGAEHRLARHYRDLSTVLDYVPDARLVVEAGTEDRVAAFFEQLEEAREEAGSPDDGALYLTPADWTALVKQRGLATASTEEAEKVALTPFVRERRPDSAFAKTLKERLKAGDRIVLTGPKAPLRRLVRAAAEQDGRDLRLIDSWSEVADAAPGAMLAIEAPIQAGFRVPEAGATVIAAADLFGGADAGAARPVAMLPIGEVELRIGDVAVDREHGLCVFEGLEAMPGGEEDALRLRFADDAIRMVPASQADRIWRYGSEEEAVSLDRLDGGTWARRRLETEAALAKAARVMLAAAEARRTARAVPLVPPAREMERFAAGFGFALTGDQARAIEAALADLPGEAPMDRLVCGDVGFGKTEVALRAAAAAVFAGRQVAVMAPTTVLARQHAATFARRFSRFGIDVAQLSRLVAPAEARRVKQGIEDGSVRLVVGTQALAGRGVRFHDLGLVIIDEEQRFGTKTKAALRKAAGDAHLLTLSATPIPRTLQAAMVGLQSLSVIATPPAVRRPIRTVIAPFEDETLRAALSREHRRGGQSFVVCPRIEDIAPMARRLAALMPDLDVVTAHGAMKPAEMDAAMVRFADGAGDVLLATSIIESGLDVPRANTMLVFDAERFGLAQLHQLRGRVGRGQRRGSVWLFGGSDKPLSATAEKRLRTLEALDRLGAGFAIAARDLDLRGAGDLVGEAQAGHVARVGLGLYQHLLQLALRAAKGEPAEDWSPEVRVGLSGRVPADYVPEPEIRLSLTTRLLRLRARTELDALRDEVEDRFGTPPEAVEALFTLGSLRIGCLSLGIVRLSGGPQGIAADFHPERKPPTMGVSDEIGVRDNRVVWRRGGDGPESCARQAAALLRHLEKAAARHR